MSLLDRFTEGWRKNRKPGYYEEFDYHWTMTIDLDRCTGCGACVTACQAENNLPIVGEEAFARDARSSGSGSNAIGKANTRTCKLSFIPMLCQHCDAAPCETVCPVSATYHNQDGLNARSTTAASGRARARFIARTRCATSTTTITTGTPRSTSS